MKILITGHTKGIGKALADSFTDDGNSVYGFSRSNGYDIGKEQTINKILEDIELYDIFINNAYHHTGQTILLNKVIDRWQGTDKMVVNISSKMSYLDSERSDHKDYILEKQKQNQIVKQNIFKGTPKILNVITGLVDTDMSSIFKAPKLDAAELAKLIVFVVSSRSKISVQELVVDVPGLDWKDIGRYNVE